ncbi:WD domain-containing protein 20 [Elsinoe fawcettii]|nr:WD domain-containing protein 20 [Elsinoe fawcettii]
MVPRVKTRAGAELNRFWEALSGICSRTIPHPDSQVNRLCISPDKRFLAAAGHHTVKLYDIKSTNPTAVLTFEGHTSNITGVQFHCEGKWMVTSSEDGTVKIWDTRTGNVQRNYSHGVPVNDVVIHPNQGELISCDRGGNVRIWDLSENKCSHQLIPEEDKSVASVTVASDGSLLCAAVSNSMHGAVYVWRMITAKDVTTLVPVTKFRAHQTYITRVLLSPDVRHLATCSADHTARIWGVDLSNPAALNPPILTPEEEEKRARNPDPGADSPFKLEQELDGHQRWVWDCAFSADSAYLVTACSDHYARLWELSSKSVIRQYNGHHRGAQDLVQGDFDILAASGGIRKSNRQYSGPLHVSDVSEELLGADQMCGPVGPPYDDEPPPAYHEHDFARDDGGQDTDGVNDGFFVDRATLRQAIPGIFTPPDSISG